MISIRKRKLSIIILMLLVAGISVALIMFALRQNISLFYTPTQLSREQVSSKNSIRVGGMVEAGSILRNPGDLTVHFKITDYQTTVDVVYRGVLPDLFREGQGVVVQGNLIDKSHVKAFNVLAKHDENYMPPEVRDALKNTQQRAS